MATGGVLTIVSVYLTQLTFRVNVFGGPSPTYAMNGFGHYRLVGRASPRFAISGHAPELGAVAIAGAVALLAAAVAAVSLKRGTVVSAVSSGVACLAAGVIAAALACEALEGTDISKYSWAAGFWLLVAAACVAAVAALGNAVHIQREAIRASGSESQ